MPAAPTNLEAWVARDRELEVKASRSSLALMEHRWRAVNEGGFSARSYATAIGRSYATVTRYVRGYALWLERGETGEGLTPNDVFELARIATEKQEAVELVAKAKGVSVARVVKELPHVAREVKHLIADRVEAGESHEQAVDYARGIAEIREQTNRAAAKRAENDRSRLSGAYFRMERLLLRALLAARDAAKIAQDDTLANDEERDLLLDRVERISECCDALRVAINGGELATDWDSAATDLLSN